MRKIEINDDQLLKLERIAYLKSKESYLFRDGNILYKKIRPEYRKGRESIITHLHDKTVPNLPLVKDLLIDPITQEFVGYSMEFLEHYKTTEDSAIEDDYSFEERKIACGNMFESINKLIVRGYEHYDIHERNIMVNGSSARIIDIDSMGNPLYGNIKRSTTVHNDPCLEMLSGITFVAINYLLNKNTFHEQYEYYTHFEELSREFKNDRIMLAFINHRLKQLISHGYTPEIMLNSIDEGQVLKLNSILGENNGKC